MQPNQQERHLFEYATIRVVPSVEREEFVNVGVVVYCSSHQFLHSIIHVNAEKLYALSREIDLIDIQQYLDSFQKICLGDPDSGPIGKLPAASRFRWLTAQRSTIIQTSRVHPGFSNKPLEALNNLFTKMVL